MVKQHHLLNTKVSTVLIQLHAGTIFNDFYNMVNANKTTKIKSSTLFLIIKMHLPAFRLSMISCVNCGSVPRLWSISVRLAGDLSCRKNPSRITVPIPSDLRYGRRSDTPECETYTIMIAFTTGSLHVGNIQSILCY